MSKSLDGKTIRIKGTDVTTKVRYCTDIGNGPRVVTELWYHPEDPARDPNIVELLTEDNTYGDEWPLDMIEIRKPDGTWYTPKFRIGGPK